MAELTPDRLAMALTTYVVLLFSLSFHESAHGWMALKLGDRTAEDEGRVSLNPIVHIDPIGTLLIPIIQILTSFPLIGWAKPTPYNPANFRRDVSLRQGHMLVAAAGPVSNLILAVVFTAAFFVAARTVEVSRDNPVIVLVVIGIQLNVLLAIFNLVPIPPLDGSKVASFGLPQSWGDAYDRVVGPYGFLILLALFMTGILWRVLGPVTSWMTDNLYRIALP